jgi:hypothetical protein
MEESLLSDDSESEEFGTTFDEVQGPVDEEEEVEEDITDEVG